MGEIARPSSDDVCQEAARQRVVEGWTVEHDLQHANGELVRAALTYITGDESWWPWDNRPKFGPRDLIKAGGLLLAEDKRREVAERRDEFKGNAVPFQSQPEIESLLRWLHAEAAFERDTLKTDLAWTAAELSQYDPLTDQECENRHPDHPRWLVESEYAEACPWCEMDRLRCALSALRDSHHIPYVDEDHQGGNCADIVIGLIGRALKAERELERLHSWQGLMSLLDEHWPAEVFKGVHEDPGPTIVFLLREVDRLRREVEFEAQAEEFYWSPPGPSDPCACISDYQAATLGPGFSRPVCAVHPGTHLNQRDLLCDCADYCAPAGLPTAGMRQEYADYKATSGGEPE